MSNEVQVIEQSQEIQMAKIEIDSQIATARQYPRDVAMILKSVAMLATIDDEIASACFYAKPVGTFKKLSIDDKKNAIKEMDSDKIVVGESARFAEIVFSNWGNLRIRSFIKSIENGTVTAVCEIHDLQNNTAYSAEAYKSIKTKNGLQSANMQEVTKMAAQSVARRNAILTVIPKGLFHSTLKTIRNKAIGLLENNEEAQRAVFLKRLKNTLDFLKSNDITEDRILFTLGLEKVSEIGANELQTLIGFGTSVKENPQSAIDIFYPDKSQSGLKIEDDKPE